MTHRWAPLLVAGALATGCDDDRGGSTDAERPPQPGCNTSPVEAGGWRVAQCSDSRALALASVDGVVMSGVLPKITLRPTNDDARWPPTHDDDAIGGWPVVVWQARGDGGTLRLHDDARATLTLDVTLADSCVEAVVTAEVTAPTEVALSPWTVESGEVGPGRSLDAPAFARPEPRVLVSLDGALMAGSVDPAWPLDVGGVDRMALTRAVSLTPGAPFTVALAVCSGPDEPAARSAFAALVAERHPRPASPTPRGWRADAAADGLAEDAALLAEWVERPTVVLDGAWYAGRGDWSPAARFPDGVRAALPPTVDVAVVWPGLQVAADGPVARANPDWLDPDCRVGCPTLDPRIPAVRDHLAREALALGERGLRPIITGLPDAPDRARALLTALPDPLTLDAFETSPPPPLGLSPTVGLRASDRLVDVAAALRAHIWLRRSVAIEADRVRLMEHPPGVGRQMTTLALLAGVRLFDDPPRLLADDPRAEIARALLTAPPLVEPRPIPRTGAITPIDRTDLWRADNALAIFNFDDRPLTVARPVDLAPDLAGAAPLFAASGHAPLGDASRVTIPPEDVVIWVTVDGGGADR